MNLQEIAAVSAGLATARAALNRRLPGLRIAAATAALALSSACSPGAPPEDTPAPADQPEAAGDRVETAQATSAPPTGEDLYEQRCAACHDNPEATRAPAKSALQAMSAAQIRFSMTSGKMQAQADGMSGEEIASLVTYLAPDGDAAYTVVEGTRCKDTSISFGTVYASRWGSDLGNSRYYGPAQTSLGPDEAKRLEVAWTFGLPGASDARVHPVITEDTVFIGASTGHAFALDRETGCIKWHNDLGVNLRSSLSLGEVSGKPAIFFQDGGTVVHALDGHTGDVLWKERAGVMPQNMGTGSPIQAGGKLIVPLSAIDVAAAGDPKYECCKGHGALTALNPDTGERLWATHMTEDAQPTTISDVGTQLYGPAGVPIWTTPTLQPEKNRVFVGTGENTSAPATDTSDAIIAMDLETGDILWKYQATEQDMFNMACSGFGPDGPNCPKPKGPDLDFGGAITLTTNAAGDDIIVAGQKAGVVHVLNADTGELIWKTRISKGSALGGIHWGLTVAGGKVFAPSSDPPFPGYSPEPGLYALDLETGDIIWSHAAERGCKTDIAKMRSQTDPWPDCSFFHGYSAAPASTDGVVFAGRLNGLIQAFDAETGDIIWEYDTVRAFDTVNGVAAHGGAIDNPGPTPAGDMLFVQSGYSAFSQMPGNAVIAFKIAQGD